jgi:hypothetical protein
VRTIKKFTKAGLFLAALACVLPLSQARAQDNMQPVVTISISSFDDVMSRSEAIAQKVGQPDAMAMPKMMLGAEGPKGVDTTKPLGAVLQTDGTSFVPLIFLPVTDVEAFLQNPWMQDQAEMIGEADADGIYTLQAQQPFYMLPKNGWVFITNKQSLLEKTPENPVTLLSGLNEKYLLGIHGDLTPFTPEMINGLLMPLQMMAATNNDPAFQENFQRSMNQIKKVANELKTMTLGIAVDPSTVDLTIETIAVAKPNTDIGIQYTANADLTTDKSGFYQPEESILAIIGAATLMQSQIEQVKLQVQQGFNGALQNLQTEDLTDEERKLAEGILKSFHEVVDATIESGDIDMGVSVLPAGEVLAGSKIAQGDKLAETLKKLLEIAAEENPELKKGLEIEAETYKGYTFTKWSMPLSEAPEADNLPEHLRDRSATVCLGTKSDGVCLIAGVSDDPVATLKKAIDDSQANTGAPLPETVGRVSFENLGKFMEPFEEEGTPPLAQTLLEQGQGAEILVQSSYQENGAQSRVIITGEVLALIPPVLKPIMAGVEAGREAGRQLQLEIEAEDIEEIEIEAP